jgi:hypothetical protein
MTAAPADQNDPGAQAALEMIKPALAAMLGRNGRGIEFALYRVVPGMHPLDPTMRGSLEYTLYRKHFHWQLPVWAQAAPVPVRAPPCEAVVGDSSAKVSWKSASAASSAVSARHTYAPGGQPANSPGTPR